MFWEAQHACSQSRWSRPLPIALPHCHPPPSPPRRSHSCQPNLFVQPVLTSHHDERCCGIALFSMGAHKRSGCVRVHAGFAV